MRLLKKYILLPLVALFLFVANANAQMEFPEDKVSWKFSIEQDGCNATIVADITCVEHWHIYAANLPPEAFSLPTEIEPDKSGNYTVVGKVIEPKPEFYHDEAADEDIYQHSKSFTLKRKIKISSKKDFTLKGRFSFQTCDETHCLPPFDTDFELKVKGCGEEVVVEESSEEVSGEEVTAESSEEELVEEEEVDASANEVDDIKDSEEPSSDNDKSSQSLWAIFLEGILGGALALFMPCIYPMLPLTVSFFMKQSKSKSEGIRKALIYGVSIIAIYVSLGMLVTILFGSDALNSMATNPWFNLSFFVLFVVFAMSFFGAFEITLPNSWANKMDGASNKGGLMGIFFMAATLAIVSFSCTGPIVGDLLVRAANDGEYFGPAIGMLGFSTSLAVPFALFAIFPSWLNSMPKSGGWLNTLKVTLGFLELALALKFLSNADLVIQGGYLKREMFLAIWIGIFFLMSMYLLGIFRMNTDSPNNGLSVTRLSFAVISIIFTIYLIPGLWGAPLKLVSGFPPPSSYSEAPLGFGGSGASGSSSDNHGPEGTHLAAQGIYLFHDLDEGMAYAKEVGKPVMLDFTGWACVNCRAMEENVWGEPGVIEIMKEDIVIISLYVDEKIELPKSEQKEVEVAPGKIRMLKTVGNKWSYLQATKYKTNSQPYYRMLGPNGEDLANGSADYQNHGNKDDFKAWLEEGLKLYNEAK